LRQRCTRDKTGRSLNLHPHDVFLRQARHDWAANPDLRATYRQHRPMVERSIAWLIGPKGRCRQLRYRGVNANDWWLHTRMAALNLRRLVNLGLTHQYGTWILVPPVDRPSQPGTSRPRRTGEPRSRPLTVWPPCRTDGLADTRPPSTPLVQGIPTRGWCSSRPSGARLSTTC
jgi:hypothetical protein